MVDDGDVFERLLDREAEIRRRLENGEIGDDEATALRELAGVHDDEDARGKSTRLRLTVEEITRMVDEGADAKVVRSLLRLSDQLSIDAAIDLAACYAPEPDWADDLRSAGLTSLDRSQLTALLDLDVSADTVRAALDAGFVDPVEAAITAGERACDPTGLLRGLAHHGLHGIGTNELGDIADNDIDPADLARMLDAYEGVSVSAAIQLLAEGVDSDVLDSLSANGIGLEQV